MKTNITLEDALAKARPGLRYRIEQSVALLRKAEHLALMYDAEDGFFLAFSGGKDSQALYHVAELAGVKFKGHFSPTTVDPPQLIRFIRKQYPEVEFGKVDKSMYQVAKEMGMVPTIKLRWCCAKFKESSGAGKVTLTGVRHAESVKRAKRKSVEVSGHKFAGDLEEFMEWSEEKREKIAKKVKNLNQDEFSRDKEQEIRCINGKDSIIINPIIEWSDADVWDFLNKVMEVPHCELYDPPFNRHRIGCILCPMSSYKTKLRDIELYPYAKREWLKVFEYFIGGGVRPRLYLAKAREIQEWCSQRGGGTIQRLQEEPCRANLSKPSSGTTRQPLRLYSERAAELPPPRRKAAQSLYPGRIHKKRQTQMGRSRGKYECGSPVRVVAYARFMGNLQGQFGTPETF